MSEPEELDDKCDDDDNQGPKEEMASTDKEEKLSQEVKSQCTPSDSSVLKPKVMERKLPRINCEERIILVVDLWKESESTQFELSEGSSYSFLYLVRRAIGLYLHNKKAINSKHKFALVTLKESPFWEVDFTNNPREIVNEMENLKEEVIPAGSSSNCDLSRVFELIKEKVSLPQETSAMVPPPYVVRTILFYGRSLSLPLFLSGRDAFQALTSSPYFFMDVLYTHEGASENNKCEGIFDVICDLDATGWSYIFEVGRNATKFHNLCSRLLAHPLQRPSQKDAHYTLVAKEAAG